MQDPKQTQKEAEHRENRRMDSTVHCCSLKHGCVRDGNGLLDSLKSAVCQVLSLKLWCGKSTLVKEKQRVKVDPSNSP